MVKTITLEIELEDVEFDYDEDDNLTFDVPDIDYKHLVVDALEKYVYNNETELYDELIESINEKRKFND